MPKKNTKPSYASYVWERTRNGRTEYFARVGYRDPSGKLKYKTQKADSREHAVELGKALLADIEQRGQAAIDGKNLTFDALANWYAENHLVPPVYSDNVKINGLRNFKKQRQMLDRLKVYFGKAKVESISDEMLHKFKMQRLTVDKVKIATVNRDLALLRTMFNKAKRKRWIKETPFDFGELLIETSLESPRTVTITEEQEARLLAAAKELSRSRLYALILALRDTGARPSEIYPAGASEMGIEFEPITWRRFFDGNFETIVLVSFKGRKRLERLVPVSDRLKEALLELWQSKQDTRGRKDTLDDYVFPDESYKKSWNQVCQQTGISNLRLRDLRRDFRSRLARLGYSDQLAQRLLGHANDSKMTYYYLEADREAVMQAKALLDKQSIKVDAKSDAVN
jgi:integrase